MKNKLQDTRQLLKVHFKSGWTKKLVALALTGVMLVPFVKNGQDVRAARQASQNLPSDTQQTEFGQSDQTKTTLTAAQENLLDQVNVHMQDAEALNRSLDPELVLTAAPTTTEETLATTVTETTPVAETETPATTPAPTEAVETKAPVTVSQKPDPTTSTTSTTPTTPAPTPTPVPTTTQVPKAAEVPTQPAPTQAKPEVYYVDGLAPMSAEEYRIYNIASQYQYIGNVAQSGSWGYDAGWCTWYVYNARIRVGKYIPNNLGNADSWPARARNQGFTVDHIPEVGAAAVSNYSCHVMFVEKVYSDGRILISEGGASYAAYTYNKRIIPAAKAKNFYYIH